MNKKAFATAVASVAVAGTIAAPAMADETATTPVEQAQQAVEQAQQAVEQAQQAVDQAAAQPTTQPQQDQVAAAQQAVTDAKTSLDQATAGTQQAQQQVQQVQHRDGGQGNGGKQVGQRPAAARQGMGIGRRMGRHKLHGRRADLLHDNRDRLCALHGLLHGQRCTAGRAETGGGVVWRSAFRTKHGKSPSVRFCLQYNETGAPCQCVLYENAFLLA